MSPQSSGCVSEMFSFTVNPSSVDGASRVSDVTDELRVVVENVTQKIRVSSGVLTAAVDSSFFDVEGLWRRDVLALDSVYVCTHLWIIKYVNAVFVTNVTGAYISCANSLRINLCDYCDQVRTNDYIRIWLQTILIRI